MLDQKQLNALTSELEELLKKYSQEAVLLEGTVRLTQTIAVGKAGVEPEISGTRVHIETLPGPEKKGKAAPFRHRNDLKSTFEQVAAQFGLKPDDYNRTITIKGHERHIIGLAPNRPRRPLMISGPKGGVLNIPISEDIKKQLQVS